MTSKVFESCEKCPIFFLALRNPKSEDEPWTKLLRLSQDFCVSGAGEKARKSYAEALNLAEDLASVMDKRANHIKATTWTCIGTLSLCGQIQPGAIENLRRGEGLFALDGDRFSQATALFALGVFNETQKEWREVRRFYERSLSVLGNLSDDAANRLRVEIKRRNNAAHDKWIEAEFGSVPKSPASSAQRSDSRQNSVLAFLPIFSQIPAGDPRTIPDRVSGYIETDRILIDDRVYRVSSVNAPRVRLKFIPEVSYVALQVSGDSMNNAGIEDGDYVILEMRPIVSSRQPQNGEIVAAAFSEEDKVTLKRFRREDKRIILEPDSLTPGHKTYTFETRTEFSLPVRIIGIHIATLKPE